MHINLPLILASQSPRRRRLLERIGLNFTVQVSPAEEVIPADASPENIVQVLARQKAGPVADQHPEALILAADTVVALDGHILGKPNSTAEAAETLQRLSGKTHTVYTGVSLIHRQSNRSVTAVEATEVTFGMLDSTEIEAYVATGSPMDKAGSYGIQDDMGALFVDGIQGDYYNVVGLPLRRLYMLLRSQFADSFSL